MEGVAVVFQSHAQAGFERLHLDVLGNVHHVLALWMHLRETRRLPSGEWGGRRMSDRNFRARWAHLEKTERRRTVRWSVLARGAPGATAGRATHLDENLRLSHHLDDLPHVRSWLLQQLDLLSQHSNCGKGGGRRRGTRDSQIPRVTSSAHLESSRPRPARGPHHHEATRLPWSRGITRARPSPNAMLHHRLRPFPARPSRPSMSVKATHD